MYQKIRKGRGITLIALVITILILVILAGVTIATLKNTNLFNSAIKAKEKSDYEAAKEAIELKLSAISTEYEMNGNGEAKLQYTADRLDPKVDSDIEYVRAEYKEEASIQELKQGQKITKIYTKLRKYKYVFEINDNIQIATIDGKKVNEIKISDTNIVNVRDSLMANNSKLIDEYEIIASNIGRTTITIDLKDKSKTINAVGYIICIGNNAVGMSEQLPYTIKELNTNTEYKEIYIIAVDKNKNTKISKNKLNEKTEKTEVQVGNKTHIAKSISSYDWNKLKICAEVIADNSNIITNDTEEAKIFIDNDEYILGIGDTTSLKDNTNNKTYTVKIIGFNNDEMVNGKKSGITFIFQDSPLTSQMNKTNTNEGGWGASYLRDVLNNENTGIYKNFENVNILNKVKKLYYSKYDDSNSLTYVEDFFSVLSRQEWYGGEARYPYHPGNLDGAQYKYYKKNNSWTGQSWTRSLDVRSSVYCDLFNANTMADKLASNSYAIFPIFSI